MPKRFAHLLDFIEQPIAEVTALNINCVMQVATKLSLYQSIDAFPRFDSVLVKPEVLLGISKTGLQSTIVAEVSNYLT